MKKQDNSLTPLMGRAVEGHKKQYIKPSIQVIEQIYGEGLMTTASTNVSSGNPNTGPVTAKPGGTWGDVWADPTSSSTTNGTGTTGTATNNDLWSN